MDEAVTNRSDLEGIASEYSHQDLLGLNELYHLVMRDQMIPSDGGRTALEVGCGNGSWTEVLCRRYQRVDVVDGSRQLLDRVVAANTGSAATLSTHHTTIEEFTAQHHGCWHHVYMTFLLEHLVDPVQVLRTIGNWIEPDGRLFVAVPNANSLHRVLAVRMGLIERTDELSVNDRRVGHHRVYTRTLLLDHLGRAGFAVLCERPIGLKPLTLRQMEHLPLEVGRVLATSGDLAPEYAAYIGIEATPAS
jgi:SAM-dependent methyltransferase